MTWQIDPAHFELGFSAKHMMVMSVRGTFSDVAAELALDEDRPEDSRVSAVVQAASLATGNADRDAHLKSADFLDVEAYPELRFESTSIRQVGRHEVEMAGQLTIKDVTQPVVLKGEFNGPVTAPWGDRRLGVSLTGEIDREAFGLTWNMALEAGGVLVGRAVKLHLEAEIIDARQAAEAPAEDQRVVA